MKKFLKVIIALILFIYILFGTDFLESLKDTASFAANTIEDDLKKAEVNDYLKVYFIDVGQADCILINKDSHNMLIDAGNNEDGSKLVSYISSLGINNFDYVVATHAHEDHIGGMDDIINNFKINSFFMPDVVTTTKTFEDVLNALEQNNLTIDIPKEDDVIDFSDATINIIHVGDEDDNLNDTSIILKLTYGNNSFLFTGDASESVEKKIINKNIKSDVLKVAHHGSSYSTSKEFLDKVKPKYAVIEVGKNNIYNHPTDQTLQRLNKNNIKIYRTDYDGTILFTSDGDELKIEKISTDTNG